jgi:hypothetical protein
MATESRSAQGRRSQHRKDFLVNVVSLGRPSALTPLLPVVELLIARLGRDELNLGLRRPKSSELEALATGLVDDLRTVCCDVAQGVDLIVMLPIGKGGDFGEQGFERAPLHRIREAHQAIVEAE